MKHYFVVNPAAGSHDATAEIRKAIAENGMSELCEVYNTKGPGDAGEYVRRICKTVPDICRFYACGGDGTLNEVTAAAAEFDNSSVSVYPCGSGNDFIKYYGTADDFKDIESLMNGSDRKIDLLTVCGRYSINIINFGFDSIVLKTMLKVRRKKIIGGKRAYMTGVVVGLCRGMKSDCTIKVDGKVLKKGKILLCTLANGMYVGGQFKCAPLSHNDDGIIDICVIDPVSRFTFLKLIGSYTKGTHLKDVRFKKIIHYCRGRHVEIESSKPLAVSIDGELVETKKFEVGIKEGAVSFAVPEKIVHNIMNKEGVTVVS